MKNFKNKNTNNQSAQNNKEERGINMNNKQNKAVNNNKGANKMVKEQQTQVKTTMAKTSKKIKTRKIGLALQQDLVELITYIYLEPNAHTKESLAHEYTTNTRKILRMVSDINGFIPCIRRNLNFIDGKTHYYFEQRFSEIDLNAIYARTPQAPALLYIFLLALIRPVSTENVMQRLNVSRKVANQLINRILDASYLLDDIETENGYIIGYHLY